MHPPDTAYAPYRRNLWRVIEGQYRSSTVRIVDTNAEHAALEEILEDAKPPVPEECRHLDYQFWSPFRYGCYPRDSRFRRAGQTPGVWYGSEQSLTAIAESIWGSLRFYLASPETPMPRRPVEHTAVQADIRSPVAIDLTKPDVRDLGNWTDPHDYSDCLALADAVRKKGGEAIRYTSARLQGGINVAVLTCAAFARAAPVAAQTWHIYLKPDLVRAHCETTRDQFMFTVGKTDLIRAS